MNFAVGSEFASLAAAQQRGDLHIMWKSQFGDILIEVKDGAVFVNGDLVEPSQSPGVNGQPAGKSERPS
jgi:hypothetical protein